MIALNVAVNSPNGLFTLLLSNQFLELKTSVFKKFSRENAFQLACADIVERFQLHAYLVLILLRNLSEMKDGFTLEYFFSDLLFQLGTLLISELVIDWLKHAFITKFNGIGPELYEAMGFVLAEELCPQEVLQKMHDQAPVVARRLGFEAIPLGCLVTGLCCLLFSLLFSLLVVFVGLFCRCTFRRKPLTCLFFLFCFVLPQVARVFIPTFTDIFSIRPPFSIGLVAFAFLL